MLNIFIDKACRGTQRSACIQTYIWICYDKDTTFRTLLEQSSQWRVFINATKTHIFTLVCSPLDTMRMVMRCRCQVLRPAEWVLLHTIQAHCHWRPNTPRPSDGHCTPVWSLRSPHTTDVQGYPRRLKHYIQNKHLNTNSSQDSTDSNIQLWKKWTVCKLRTTEGLMLQEAIHDIKKKYYFILLNMKNLLLL